MRITHLRYVVWGFLLFSIVSVSAFTKTIQLSNWTFLIFMNGNNDLDPYGAMDINEMEQVGSSPNLNIVVQWASLANQSTKRLWIQKDSDSSRVTSPIVQDLGKPVDMGNYQTLIEFIEWGVKTFPAKHYFIDIWNHGAGWKPFNELQDISWDDLSKHAITTEEVGIVARRAKELFGHNVDILGTDACNMSMVEVAEEISDVVDVFIGSEDLEPDEGWPYDLFLREWENTPTAPATEISKILTRVYVEYYATQGEKAITLSSFDLKKIAPFNKALHDFALAILTFNTDERNHLLSIVNKETTFFADTEYIDVVDLLDRISKTELINDHKAVIDRTRMAANDFVISNHYSNDYSGIGGVSIWFPTDATSKDRFFKFNDIYKTLQFNKRTQWSYMLDALLGNVIHTL